MAHRYQRGLTWWIQYYKNGERIQESLKTKDERIAKFKQNEIENRLAKGDSPLPDIEAQPLDVFEEYKNHCKNIKSEKTQYDDSIRIKKFLDWALVYSINDINEALVRKYLDSRINSKEKKITFNTANHIITNLKTFLNWAVSRKYLSKNPIEAMPHYKFDRLPPKFLSKEEIKAILEAAKGESLYPMIATAIYTGMRYGELKRMKPEDINFKQNIIIVPVSKSKKFRSIPIHDTLTPILKKKDSVPFSLVNSRRIFKRIRKKAKLSEEVGFQTFRHTFASHLVMSGVDLVTVKDLLGHSSIKTTMIYSHLFQEHVRKSVGKLKF
jgi:integrase